jgi:hypothetical protein
MGSRRRRAPSSGTPHQASSSSMRSSVAGSRRAVPADQRRTAASPAPPKTSPAWKRSLPDFAASGRQRASIRFTPLDAVFSSGSSSRPSRPN